MCQWELEWGALLGLKRPARDVEHKPPYSAEVKSEWGHNCHPHVGLNYVGTAVFTFTFYVP
jgi:hypothetical protein